MSAKEVSNDHFAIGISADDDTSEKKMSNQFFAEENVNFEDMRSAENMNYNKLEIQEENKNGFLDQRSQNQDQLNVGVGIEIVHDSPTLELPDMKS